MLRRRRAKRSYSTCKVRRGGSEEILLMQGKEQWLCWRSREEIPHVLGKRNPSKMVGVVRGHQKADTLKPQSQKTSQSNHTRTTALSNSMKLSHALWGHPRQAGMVERSDTMWSTREGNGKRPQYSCLENPMSKVRETQVRR